VVSEPVGASTFYPANDEPTDVLKAREVSLKDSTELTPRSCSA
jgi:hypothetical protein